MAWVNMIDEFPDYTLDVFRDVGGGMSFVDPADYASLGITVSVVEGRVQLSAPDIDSNGGGYRVLVYYSATLGVQTVQLVDVVARCNDDPSTPQMTSLGYVSAEGVSYEEVSPVDGQAAVEFPPIDVDTVGVTSTRPAI